MKTLRRFVIAFLALVPASVLSAGEERVSVTGSTKDGVEVTASCPRNFPDNREVEISLEISNHSGDIIRNIWSNGIEDVWMELFGPDGDKIVGYHEMKDPPVFPGYSKRRIIDRIEPDGKMRCDPLRVSHYWPLKKAGEYRCVLTKRVYRMSREDDAVGNRLSTDRGEPVDIRLPELRFGIEWMDETYVSSLVPKPNPWRQWVLEHKAVNEPADVRLWISMGVVLLGGGYLLGRLLVRKRRKTPVGF